MKTLATAALAGLFAFSCGGTPSASSPSQAANTAAATATVAASATAARTATAAATASAASTASSNAAPRKIQLSATNTNYSITTLEVKPGEKLEFVLTNTGDEKHNLVGIGSDISLVSPDFDAGATVSWIWTAPTKTGTFKFQCAYHPTIAPILVTVK